MLSSRVDVADIHSETVQPQKFQIKDCIMLYNVLST